MYPEPRRSSDDADSMSDDSDDFDESEDFELEPEEAGDAGNGRRSFSVDDLIELDELGDIEAEIAALLAQPPAQPDVHV